MTENVRVCYFCGCDLSQATRPSRLRLGLVCETCVPYEMSSMSWAIHKHENSGQGIVTNTSLDIQRCRSHAILVRHSFIHDITIGHINVYTSSVTFDHCHFNGTDVSRIHSPGKIDITRCTGNLTQYDTGNLSIDSSNLTLRASADTLTITNSTVTLTSAFPPNTIIRNSTVICARAWDTSRIDIDTESQIKLPEVKTCVVCKRNIIEDVYTYAHKSVHEKCVMRKSSSTPNPVVIGNKKDGYNRFSIELEMNDNHGITYQELALDLITNGFVRKGDGTVSDEFVSPIYKHENEFLQCEDMFKRASRYVNEYARTHLHVGIPLRLKTFLHNNVRIFASLSDYLISYEHDTERFFGCGFSSLCPPVVDTCCRFHYINVCSHYQTVEYRLAQLQSWQQYLKVVRFYREFTKFLHTRCLQFPEYKTSDSLERSDVMRELQQDVLNFYRNYSRF